MHDGSMATLEEVLRHYGRGGRARGPHTSSLLAGFRLTERERADILAFLNALTDERLVHDRRLADPFR
jgi:cytochrome c peroxidase